MSISSSRFPHLEQNTDFYVIGGGMAGFSASITAARHGIRVILIQDRSVLGGKY